MGIKKLPREIRELLQEIEGTVIQIECQVARLRQIVGEKLNTNAKIRQNDKS